MSIKTAVVLAAGRGKRMNPLTKIIPKPMLRIAGRPLLEHLIRKLQKIGMKRVIIVVGHLKDHITSYFNGGETWRVKVQYSIQNDLQGMANALKTTKNMVLSEQDILICAADTLVASHHLTRLIHEHRRTNAAITLCLQKITLTDPIAMALVQLEKDYRVSFIIEKPSLSQAPSNIACLPIYIMRKNIYHHLEQIKKSKRGEYELQDAIQATIEQGERVQGVLIDSRLTLNTIHDYLSVNWKYLDQHITKPIRGSVAEGTIIKPPVLICQNSVIKTKCELGPYCYLEKNVQLEEGVSVKNSIILPGTHVKRNVRLINSVIFPNTMVPADIQVGEPGADNITCYPDT